MIDINEIRRFVRMRRLDAILAKSPREAGDSFEEITQFAIEQMLEYMDTLILKYHEALKAELKKQGIQI